MTTPENPLVVPGTVRLIKHEEATDDSTFILSPTPSSDPNDPLNWPLWRKYLNFGLTIAVTIAVFTNLSIQIIFWQQIIIDLGFTTTQLSRAQSAQLAGLALGCIFFIPFAIKFGRRPVYLASTAVLAAASWWTSSIHSSGELFVTAVITGLAGAINETAVQMTIADLFFIHQRGSANGIYFIAVMSGSFIIPLAAGSQAAVQGWRWSYYSLAIALTVLFLAFIVVFEETKYIPVSIAQNENSPSTTNQPSPSDDLKSDLEKTENDTATRVVSIETSIPMKSWRQRLRLTTVTSESLFEIFILPLRVIMFPHVIFTALQFAAAVCGLVLFMSVVSIVFSQPPYSFTTAGIGYMTLGPFVGNLFGSIYGGPFSDWVIVKLARRNGGIFEPEMRLYPMALPVVMVVGGIIMFGITADRGMHWIYPSIGGGIFAFGIGSIGDITFTLIIDTYHELTAEAFVGVAFIRNAVSVAVTFALVPWMSSMSLSNMFIVYGCLAGGIGFLHIPLIIWGKRIRTALAPRYWRLEDKRVKL